MKDLPICKCGHENMSHPIAFGRGVDVWPCAVDGCDCEDFEEALNADA